MGEQVGARSKERRTGKPDEIDAGFTSDLREKAYFPFRWLIKHQSALYLENCIHEDLIKLIKYP